MIWASLSLHLPFQIAECIDSAKGVVKYFKNKTVVHCESSMRVCKVMKKLMKKFMKVCEGRKVWRSHSALRGAALRNGRSRSKQFGRAKVA